MTAPRIAIIGLGTAGQAAAIALGRQVPDAEITLFEQAAEPGPAGAGFLLQPTGQAVLARWGLLAEAQALGARVECLLGHNHRGRLVMDMRYDHADPQRQGLGLQRGALFELLHRHQPATVRWEPGSTITRLEPDAGRLHDHRGREHGPFDLIVVADGSRSSLREQQFGPRPATPYPWGAWWCLVPAEGWSTPHELNQRYRLARQMAGLLPVGRHRPDLPEMLCLYWSMPADQAPPADASSHTVAEALAPLWPEAARQLRAHAPRPLAHATYRAVNLPRWHHGRAVWIGDAAHGMSPQLGQGVNMALLDAMVLADALGPRLDLQQLPRFAAQRQRHVRWYRWASHGLTPLFQSRADLLARMRDLVFTPASRTPGMRSLSRRLLSGTLGLPAGTFPALPLQQIDSALMRGPSTES
ncbi:NAD(P)/FAD-dependent oxidoreductase [Ideonella sp. DXS29W]|uniref:NAD(P)/FAD-dependent oxidoreductase n=1 Tax=Ideonella lacteola TaxID=2984193 RepID=A0ABU9BVW7_9BURK